MEGENYERSKMHCSPERAALWSESGEAKGYMEIILVHLNL